MPNEIPKIPKLTPGEQFWKDYGSQQLNEYKRKLKKELRIQRPPNSINGTPCFRATELDIIIDTIQP